MADLEKECRESIFSVSLCVYLSVIFLITWRPADGQSERKKINTAAIYIHIPFLIGSRGSFSFSLPFFLPHGSLKERPMTDGKGVGGGTTSTTSGRGFCPRSSFLIDLHLLIIHFADCYFGKKVYELEETWHPDLGSPFGVMYCIRCECMAVSYYLRLLLLIYDAWNRSKRYSMAAII